MLNETYTTSELTDNDGSTLGHINDAVVQPEMSMFAAAAFWQEALRDFDIDRPMPLPFDRRRGAGEPQTGRRTSVSFEFGDDLSQAALTYASNNGIEPEYLVLACYYAFLFKLTNGERDLCVAMNIDGRYTPEPCSMIGMSVNTIPLRYRVHPHRPFATLVEGVRLMAIRSLKYFYYTLQRILAQHSHVSKAAFLDTSFEFRSNPSQLTNGSVQLADVILQTMPGSLQISADQIVSKPDFSLNVEHDLFTDQLSFTIRASLDLFDPETIDKIAQRFLLVLKQLFEFSVDRPIYELSLILSDEMALIQSLNNTKVAFPPVDCVHHEFARQASEHSQKVAVVLDEQSLTYGELLHSVWLLSLHLREKVELGDIVCQCMERSIEMVVGLLAILTCGASYCPVSPLEPLARVSTVVRDAGAKMVLTHRQTSHQIAETCPSSCVVEIDLILNAHLTPEQDVKILDSVLVKTARIAYVIFTSGTSGKPKAVTVSHSHFLQYLQSSVHVDAIRPSDIITQVSSCTWDVHLHEILGSLLVGGSVVLLRPDQSNRNMDHLARIVEQQQVTAICVVPTLLAILFDTVQAQQTLHRLRTVRLFWSTGEPIQCSLAARILPLLSDGCKLINFGGATEGTVAQTIRIVTEFDEFSPSGTVPLGRPMPNFRCYVLDEYFQLVPIGYMGELYIGGPIMDGYLNQPELNSQVLIRIPYESNKCYKTGDLARLLPESGEIQLYGRKDFQLKLRGQRVDLNEIEATIYRYGVAVSKCVVTKTVELEQEHLVAYIQLSATADVSQFDEHQIRTVCQTHLPQWMVPSFFIILNQLPLNVNGKVDRAALPKPDLPLLLAPTNTSKDHQGNPMPMTTDEERVHDLWRTFFHLSNETRIPVDCSFFSLGGNSLAMMRLYVKYQALFQVDWSSTSLNISIFFRQSTIAAHARILGSMALRSREERQDSQPRPNDKIIEGKAYRDAQDTLQAPASFEQESIWLDEQMRFRSDNDGVAIYHIVLAFRVLPTDGKSQLITSRLRSSLQLLVEKHASLRTCLQMSDDDQSELRQHILLSNSIEVPLVESWIDNDDDLYNIIADEETNRSHFDLIQGHVFRSHVIRYRKGNDDSIIVFNFHHSAFDGTSEVLFLNDLCEAYSTGELTHLTNEAPTYLDYAQWERQLDMSAPLAFWKNYLKAHQILELPYDRVCSTAVRTGRGSSVLVHHGDALIVYARQRQVTLFQLCLATYYVFLYKLIGSRDLMVGSVITNRTRLELSSVIGMFANLVPYRLQIEPHETFQQLIERVQSLCNSVLSNLQLPFQTLSKLLHSTSGIVTTLEFETVTTRYSLDNNLQLSRMTTPVNMTLFDLSILFKHDRSTNMITCTFEYSLDVFDRPTIEILARRFQLLLTQLLDDDQQPIYGFSILLDNERQLLHDFNPPILIPEFEPCHWILSRETDDHPQKIGIIMEEQCLSYGEILHYAQQWATHILATCHVNIGDIVLQVVERSIHIVLGVFAIWMCGAVYSPFNPRNSFSQLHSRIDKLRARVLLIHEATRSFATLDSDITVIDLDRIPLEQHSDVSILDSISVKSDYLSHILFTSDSTGESKAIQLNHRNFVSYTRSAVINSTSIVLHHRSVAFDSHLDEIAGSLISGAQVVLLKPDPCHLDMDYFSTTIARYQVTFIGIVPTALITMTNLIRSLPQVEQDSRLKSLRCIVSGGEKLYVTTVLNLRSLLNPECVILNSYGPAECAVAASCYTVTGKEAQNYIGLPIGRPLAYTQIYILDEFLQEVIPGQIGEIVIGGGGVFIGYWNQDELTRQVVIDYKGSRCYRTGDFGRLNVQTGQLEFLRRRDHQIKIRGQRIELDSIEQVILRFNPKILNCLVVKGSIASNEHLIAYVEYTDDQYSINENEIRDFCQQHLTSCMVPSFFVVLDHFPLNPSGKVDRARLPQPTVSSTSKNQNQVLSPLEHKLCSIFALAFDLSDPSLLNVETTFAELGATSLGIIKALGLIRRQQLNGSHPVDISTLVANPSVRLLAQALDSSFSYDDVLTKAPSEIELVNLSSSPDQYSNDKSPSRSLLIETLGILFLIYIFAMPIYLALRLSLIFAPMLHLLTYIVFKRLFMLPSSNESYHIYSLVYYQWWFLQRLWKLNDPWHRMLHGTSLYNTYLRLCGARIGVNVHLRTSLIDQPDLLDIGDNSFVAEDVVLSSMTYESEKTFRLATVHIGTRCKIGARSVLHSEVHIKDQISVKPLTAITDSIDDDALVNGLQQECISETNEVVNEAPTNIFNSLLSICVVWFIHECLLHVALIISQFYWSLACLIWLLGCISISFITLKWLPSSIESWWSRQLLVTAFGFAIPLTFEGNSAIATEYIYPQFVHWLGRICIGRNVRTGTVTNLLMIRRNLLNIGSNVTLGSDILFDDGNAITCIEDGASFGNDCFIEAGAHIPPSANVGSMTRVDNSPDFTQSNQVLFGIPARQTTTLFVTVPPSLDGSFHRKEASHSIIRSIFVRFVSLLLVFGIMHVTILPISLILFSLIVCTLSSPRKEDLSLLSCLSRTLVNDFILCLGPFLGGTQWLNILLNAFGATIHRTAIIADIDCIDDPHMIQIGSHVRIDQRARIQAHTNEYRQLYMRPVSIGTRCHLMPNAFVLPGCHLDGNNIIYPCTLIMKGDQLPVNTDWEGSPARHCSHSANQ